MVVGFVAVVFGLEKFGDVVGVRGVFEDVAAGAFGFNKILVAFGGVMVHLNLEFGVVFDIIDEAEEEVGVGLHHQA